ncbi:type III secretion system gatekeeper subunit SctW [Burkholderia semiarida]|uniref:Type III secretion system gatekeeper subunit SctW n=1 Tax=Burkholderia semiarida TaxID=2843303 RepID=A0ABW7LDD1_9BURK
MSINGPSSFGYRPPATSTRMLAEARRNDARRLTSEKSPMSDDFQDLEMLEEFAPASVQQKLADLASQMGSIASQFQRRREFERKRNSDGDSFDRVLDEDAEPKAEKLFQIATVQRSTLAQLLQQARKLFPDESDLYSVLKELLKRKQLSRAQRSTLQGLTTEVERQADPKSLKGGVNCALKAKLFGRKLKIRAQLLRQTYRKFLECDGAVLSEYEGWIGTYGHEHRQAVMSFVEESLSTDIHASDPSCSVVEFGYLIGHVKKLQRLRAADVDFVGGLLGREVLPDGAEADALAREEVLLLLLCGLLRADDPVRSVLPNTLRTYLDRASKRDRAVVIAAVRHAYRMLPDELFVNERDLDEVAHDFNQMMDDACELERQEDRTVKMR